jgi:uncharacterized protein YndB with AHSA1/START domain
MKGTLEQAGTRWRLRFTRDLDHPVPRVWQALTEAGDLEGWFPFRITGDWIVGGLLTFSESQGRVPDFTGEVLAYQPPALLEFRWGPDTLRMEVAGRDQGCTLTLLHTFDELGKASRDAAGWHVCLDTLARYLEGTEAPPAELWSEVHPGYVSSFGPEASAIGVPAGYEPG